VRHKGVHVILDALKIARLSQVRLDVHGPLGDPAYAAQLRAAAAEMPGLTLNLLGAYEPSQLPALLHDADCLIAPSQWPETFLLVSREALAHGVPVIVSRLGALPDAVADGVNGLSFDHDDPEQLAGHLRRLFEDDELVRRLRDGARRSRVRSVEEHVDEIFATYGEAIRDLAGGIGGERRADLEELGFLHASLHEMETGAARCASC
jgi:glycosyltransferase involved in cell wall biosynthesis